VRSCDFSSMRSFCGFVVRVRRVREDCGFQGWQDSGLVWCTHVLWGCVWRGSFAVAGSWFWRDSKICPQCKCEPRECQDLGALGYMRCSDFSRSVSKKFEMSMLQC
jgi:hypothetical protein